MNGRSVGSTSAPAGLPPHRGMPPRRSPPLLPVRLPLGPSVRTCGTLTPAALCTTASQSPGASPQRKGKGRSRRDVDGESNAAEGRNDCAEMLRLLPRRADAISDEAELTSALAEALTQINSAHKCFKSQPNRASKLYFTAAKCALFASFSRVIVLGWQAMTHSAAALAQLGRIREAAETLQFLLLLQHVEHHRGQEHGPIIVAIAATCSISLYLVLGGVPSSRHSSDRQRQ
jgi:hypothetical protein